MSDSDSSTEIILAKWIDRFFAWLIDFLIVSVISTSIVFASFGTMEFGDGGFWAEIYNMFQPVFCFLYIGQY